MAWKLLRLKPIKPFFFGRQKVFGNTNYAISEYFPQQTQIAGALRLYWMEQNNLMRVQKDGKYVPKEKIDEAQALVGSAGIADYETNDDLGMIKNISPMFILKMDGDYVEDALFEIPHDVTSEGLAWPEILDTIKSSKKVTMLLHNFSFGEPKLKGFGNSFFWSEYDYGRVSQNDIIEHDDIFRKQEQVGIALDDQKQTVDEKFYTKVSYELKRDYEFGVLIDLDEETLEADKKFGSGLVPIGADSSMFRLVVEGTDNMDSNLVVKALMYPQADNVVNKTVLLSDSMLDNSIHPNAVYQIVPHSIPFRMMDGDSKTDEKLLVPKGSVYYFYEPDSLPVAKGAYAKMGFNRYLILD